MYGTRGARNVSTLHYVVKQIDTSPGKCSNSQGKVPHIEVVPKIEGKKKKKRKVGDENGEKLIVSTTREKHFHFPLFRYPVSYVAITVARGDPPYPHCTWLFLYLRFVVPEFQRMVYLDSSAESISFHYPLKSSQHHRRRKGSKEA